MVLVNDALGEFDLNAAAALLPPWRLEKALRYVRETDTRQSIAAWLLLREACLRLGLPDVPPVAFGEHGKPFFPDHPSLHFNLSHCREAAACVVADAPVGIDVEAVMPPDREVMERVLSGDESRGVRASPDPAVEFTRLWTVKESFLKLTGEGLTDDLPSLLARAEGVTFRTVVRARYVYTVASRGDAADSRGA